jgi:hypothetical protein
MHRFRQTVTIGVPLRIPEAIALFTARGERDWVDGWEPEFPAGEPGEEDVGTVFVTASGGRPTYWVVVARTASGVRYARTTPGLHAGTVDVRGRAADARSTRVDVTYDLTALGPAGTAELDRIAAGYPAQIQGWQHAIETALRSSGSQSA